jgi:hypothetical protein
VSVLFDSGQEILQNPAYIPHCHHDLPLFCALDITSRVQRFYMNNNVKGTMNLSFLCEWNRRLPK